MATSRPQPLSPWLPVSRRTRPLRLRAAIVQARCYLVLAKVGICCVCRQRSTFTGAHALGGSLPNVHGSRIRSPSCRSGRSWSTLRCADASTVLREEPQRRVSGSVPTVQSEAAFALAGSLSANCAYSGPRSWQSHSSDVSGMLSTLSHTCDRPFSARAKGSNLARGGGPGNGRMKHVICLARRSSARLLVCCNLPTTLAFPARRVRRP